MTLFDESVRHAIYIERYKARTVKEIKAKVRAVSTELYEKIAASNIDQMTRRELDALLAEINRIIKGGYGPILAAIENELKEFAVYEGGWQANNIRKFLGVTLGVPSDADLWAAMYARPFQGRVLREWLAGLEPATARRVREAIRQGYVQGLSPLEIAREIRGTRARRGIMDISARGAEIMVRTAINHTAARAQEVLLRKNPQIKEVQHVSILDGRTTPICQSLDGRIFTIGTKVEKRYRLPLHPGERSMRLPVTDRNRERLKTRRTFQDWLKGQSPERQDDILGPERGELFRDGGYSVDKFVDPSGRQYTLDELRAKE